MSDNSSFFKIVVAENCNDLEHQQLSFERQLLLDSKKQYLIGSKNRESVVNAQVVSGLQIISAIEIKLEGVEKVLATCKNAIKIKQLQALKVKYEENIKTNREILEPRMKELEIFAKNIQALENEIADLEHPTTSTYSSSPP